MELQKLRSHAKKILKNRQKLKCLSLGLIVHPQKSLTLTQQQLSQQMINSESCLHKQNNNEVLIVQFRNQVPQDGKGYSKINKLYECFIKNLHTILDKVNQGEEEEQERLDDIRKIENNKRRLQNLGKNNSRKSKKELAVIAQQMTRIYEQTDKKHQIKRYKIAKIQKQIQKLYIESHQYYLQLMQIKSAIQTQIQASRILSQKQSLQNSQNIQQNLQQNKYQSNPQILNNQSQIKINLQTQSPRQRQKQKQQPKTALKLRSRTISITIKNTKQYQDMSNKIIKIKQIIDKKQQQCRKLNQEEIRKAQQKIGFLKLLLKNGYHLSDGIWWILVKLAQNKVKLKFNDFYDLLDMSTKQILIQQYNQISQEVFKNKTFSLPKIKQSASVKSKDRKQEKNRYENFSQITQSRLINIQKYNTSLQIYKQTQDYIAQWVRKQKWRVRSLKHKPIEPQDSRKDWIHGQVKRLKKTYSKQKYEQITMYIFGSTKYYQKITPDKIQQFLIPRRHKDSNRDNDTALSSQKGLKSVELLSRNNTVK